jgi:hypothetical protein
MNLTSTVLYSKCGSKKCILYVKQWGLFLLASYWSFPTVHFLQHFSFTCDLRSLSEEVSQDQIPDSFYSPWQAWTTLWSLPSQAWGYNAVMPDFLLFRVETASSTWKSGQQSVEGIPHSVSKERAPALTERALATPEQKLPFTLPRSTHHLQPLRSHHIFPNAHCFASTIII